MRATEFISELFNQNKTWEWSFRGSEEAYAEFTVGNINYLWIAHSSSKQPTSWIIEFKVADEADQDKMFGLTGTGNSAEVMSTVVDITRSFLKEYTNKVTELSFMSAEESRTALYARMVKRLLPDWKLESVSSGSNTIFKLTSPSISH